ncbi:MAG: hypothetical protein WC969_13180 [Elusimicrobiota bacterium]|jgi:hypothetical protein
MACFRSPLLLIVFAAFALRCAAAIVTEKSPIFPAYYYTDAQMYDRDARRLLRPLTADEVKLGILAPGRELYTNWIAALYRVFTPVPLVPKLFNALLASLAILLFGLLARFAVGGRAALLATLLLALWPTHVFYSSQNLKEAWMALAVVAAVYFYLRPLSPSARGGVPSSCGQYALASASLVLCGLLRGHLIPILSAALFAAALLRGWERRGTPGGWRLPALAAVFIAATFITYRPLSTRIVKPLSASDLKYDAYFLKVATPPSDAVSPPQASPPPAVGLRLPGPRWISDFRRLSQDHDREWANNNMERKIETQLFPDATFNTWRDLLFFAPKAAFYSLFMPLPGLYPMDGKLGRILASMENVLALLLFFFALAGLRRGFDRAVGFPLLALFSSIWLAYSIFEFDLGSATRHRMLYLPFLLPFAAAGLDPILCRWSRRWRSLD